MRASVNNRSLGQRRIRVVTAGLATLGVAGSVAVAGYTGLARSAVASTSPTKQSISTSTSGSDDSDDQGSTSKASTANTAKGSHRVRSGGSVAQAPAVNPPAATSGGS